ILIEWANNGDQGEQLTAQTINKLLPLLVLAQPERSLQLVTTLLRFIPLEQFMLQPLANRLPQEVAELILAQKAMINLNWQKLVPTLASQQILALCEKQSAARNHSYYWFPLISVEKRLFIYTNGRRFLLNYYNETLPYPIVAALPNDQREDE